MIRSKEPLHLEFSADVEEGLGCVQPQIYAVLLGQTHGVNRADGNDLLKKAVELLEWLLGALWVLKLNVLCVRDNCHHVRGAQVNHQASVNIHRLHELTLAAVQNRTGLLLLVLFAQFKTLLQRKVIFADQVH